MTPQELFAKSLMTYDAGADSHDSFYYSLPYVKDYDLCNWRPLRMLSGNIIKYYQYSLDKPVILFTDPEGDSVNAPVPATEQMREPDTEDVSPDSTDAMPFETMSEDEAIEAPIGAAPEDGLAHLPPEPSPEIDALADAEIIPPL